MMCHNTDRMRPVCPVCAEANLGLVRSFGQYSLWQCAACGVQHWNPLVHPEASYYETEAMGLYAEKHRGESGFENRFALFLDEFGDVRGKRVLDVGCSDGWLLSRLAVQGNEVCGIDIDARALQVARERGVSNLHRASVEEFVVTATREDLRFDLITMFDVLEHTTDPVRVVRDLSMLLAPGGRLIGTVPHRRRLFANLVVSDFPPHHFFRFDAPSLRACISQGGLGAEKVIAFEWGYAGPVAIAAVRRRVRTRLGLAAESGRARAASRDGARPSLKLLATRSLLSAAALSSQLVERPLGRGFKLYFVATR